MDLFKGSIAKQTHEQYIAYGIPSVIFKDESVALDYANAINSVLGAIALVIFALYSMSIMHTWLLRNFPIFRYYTESK